MEESRKESCWVFLRIGHRAFVKKERGSRLSVFPFIDLPIRPACWLIFAHVCRLACVSADTGCSESVWPLHIKHRCEVSSTSPPPLSHSPLYPFYTNHTCSDGRMHHRMYSLVVCPSRTLHPLVVRCACSSCPWPSWPWSSVLRFVCASSHLLSSLFSFKRQFLFGAETTVKSRHLCFGVRLLL